MSMAETYNTRILRNSRLLTPYSIVPSTLMADASILRMCDSSHEVSPPHDGRIGVFNIPDRLLPVNEPKNAKR